MAKHIKVIPGDKIIQCGEHKNFVSVITPQPPFNEVGISAMELAIRKKNSYASKKETKASLTTKFK